MEIVRPINSGASRSQRKGGQFPKGHVPHNAKGARRGEDEEAAVAAAGTGVGDVSGATGGKKLDDVAATQLSGARQGSSAVADTPSQVPANVSESTVDIGGVVAANKILSIYYLNFCR